MVCKDRKTDIPQLFYTLLIFDVKTSNNMIIVLPFGFLHHNYIIKDFEKSKDTNLKTIKTY